MELDKRHRESLEALRSECDFEDGRLGDVQNFVRWEQLTRSHGAKTRAELVEAGLAEAGQHGPSGAVGHRITEAGRQALATPPAPKPRSPAPKLRKLGDDPRLTRLEDRLARPGFLGQFRDIEEE